MAENSSDEAQAPRVPELPHARSSDPGDETERNYRYQHAYGVVILVAVHRGVLDYVSIYCEHHEDFLCERADKFFDAYQIKTSRPEGGAWTLTSPPLVKSVGRFVELLTAFPTQIGKLLFVSNSDVDRVTSESKDATRRGRCPGLFLSHVKSCAKPASLQDPYRSAFAALGAELACNTDTLFEVLQRLDIVKGPSRDDFDAALAHEHLGKLSACAHLPAQRLGGLRDELVAMFHRAASLHVDNPDRHVRGIFARSAADPVIDAKRIVCREINFTSDVPRHSIPVFHGAPRVPLGPARAENVLEKKLVRGGLADTVEFMKERERAAEYRFLEDQAKDSQGAGRVLRQIEESVHGECLEAYMAAKTPGTQFGSLMFNDVTMRLRRLEKERSALLNHAPYEILIGTAALLTSECRVWWSERFKLDDGESK